MNVLKILLTCLLTSCFLWSSAPSHAQPRSELTYVYSQDANGANAHGAEVFARALEEKSFGNVKVILRSLSTSEISHRLQELLAIDRTIVVSPSALLAKDIAPELSVLTLPYLFSDKGAAFAAMDGDPGALLKNELEKHGLVSLGFWDGQFNVIAGSRIFRSPLDFKGRKLIATSSSSLGFSALGATTLQVPAADTFSAISRGLADGAEATTGISASIFHTSPAVTVTNHSYSAQLPVISKESWRKLTGQEQTSILFAAREGEMAQRKRSIDSTKIALAEFSKLGRGQVYFLAPAERALLSRVAQTNSAPIIQASTTRISNSFREFVNRYEAQDAGRVDATMVPVFFATNRSPTKYSGQAAAGFSDRRSDKLHYGRAWVAVPKSHKFGSSGSNWLIRLWSGDDRLSVSALSQFDESTFSTEVASQLSARTANERSMLVYVHGYMNSFDDSVLRAAQIGADLQFPGVIATFSWPSKGKIEAYPADEASIEASEADLTRFLLLASKLSPGGRLHVIAHSMGNRGFARAVNSAAFAAATKNNVPLGQVILAAPDIDADVFRQLATVFPRISARTTMYSSSKDAAVWASRHLHGYARAGYAPPVTIIPGVDTIDTSNIDVDLIGHGYVAEAEALLNDIFSLVMNNGPPPNMRSRLRARISQTQGSYWSFAQ